MARRARIAAAGALLAWLALPVLPASAGGGCHTGVTQGTGNAVVMQDACFTPTILQVEPGATVAFSNEDPMMHNVTANGWGYFDAMNHGDGFTATFEGPGVYPYACTYHPGMTGAVVVGNGKGEGNGEFVAVEPLIVPEDEPAEPAAEPVAAARPASSSSVGWVGGGALGLLAGIAVGALATRRRGGTTTSTTSTS